MAATDAKAAEAELIAFAAAMPEAWEDHPWDHTVLKVGKKVFVFFGGAASPPGELSVTVKLPTSYEMALTLPYVRPAGHGLWKGAGPGSPNPTATTSTSTQSRAGSSKAIGRWRRRSSASCSTRRPLFNDRRIRATG